MYVRYIQCAFLALPFIQAATGTSILTSGIDIVDQVNKALGNILPTAINTKSLLDDTISDIRKELSEIDQLSETFAGLLQAVVAGPVPTSVPDALALINATIGNAQNGVTIENVAQAILDGVSITDLTQNVLSGYALSSINSYNNVNPPPPIPIYPQKQANDAPYSVPEAQLRAAIYIPPSFSYGAANKRPILFVPGTGAYGGVNFISNLGKLLGNDPRFDPVYLNVPGAMLDDTQINSEYIAYAINYLSAITANSNRLAVIPWSQGNPDTQWAFQYWPSTRCVVEDFISISADFHGTTLAYFLDPAFPNIVPNPPSIIQQEYDSNFILTLRAGGGGSPYVPSTSVWSITDEIVQPQYSPYASAAYFTQDLPGTPNTAATCPANNNVAYTNNQIQTVCAGLPAGGVYTHEGVLYNPLAYALALDALINDGPGRVDRLDLTVVCNQLVAPGLTPADVAATEGLIPLALLNILIYPNKVLDEPAVRTYAIQANQNCANSNAVCSSSTTTSTTSMSSTSTSSMTTTTSVTTTTTSSYASSTSSTSSSYSSSTLTTSTSYTSTTTTGSVSTPTQTNTLSSSTTTSKSGGASTGTSTTSSYGSSTITSTTKYNGSSTGTSKTTSDDYTSSTPTTKYDFTETVKVTRTKTVCPCDSTTTSVDWSAWETAR